MADPDILERIDSRLAEGNELMRENREALDACRRAYEEQKQFTREMLLRFDKSIERSDVRWRAALAESRAEWTAALERSDSRWRATLNRYFGPGDGAGPAGAGA